MYNFIDIAKLLISNGADVNAKTSKYGHPPLLVALQLNCLEIAELLLSSGADIDAKCINGYSGLHFAVGRRSLDQAKFLVSHHIDMDAKDENGRTALDYAYMGNLQEMISYLEQKYQRSHPSDYILYVFEF